MRVKGGKLAKLLEIQARLGISAAETMAVGDDIPDLPMREAAAVFACPSDAHASVLRRADWIASRPGGHGAVRELCDKLLVAQGQWDVTSEEPTS